MNSVHFEQGASQIAGIGGAGGSGNHADGGPVVFSVSHPTTVTLDVHDILTDFSVGDYVPDSTV
ncbi:hypothetical protein [Microvirga lotononidis]|uniref:Uncharacterized protein n=2 Tax=Microvirga lotononidis TaxID=864069 RepID=I4YTE6_9HYPH|nr:hypothetical protein [Microvirga lotononidis]EIM27238.1 hypothetical protein MicloDRAFT_00037960 [Microvirga lotononidis]